MARLDGRHWQVDPGQNWATVAAAVGCTRKALIACNGHDPAEPPPLRPGRIVHTPLVGTGE